jgi:hypothetical protein
MKNDLSVLVLSCDKYSHLLQYFTVLFDKYWGPAHDCEKYITTETSPVDFKGYNHIVTNEQNWTNSLMIALEQIKTPYVFIILDDIFLVREMPYSTIQNGLNIVKQENLDKYTFHYPHVVFNNMLHPTSYANNIYKVDQNSEYTMTTQMSIWNVDFIKKCLLTNESPWQFEIEGSTRVNQTIPHNIFMEVNEAYHIEAMTRGQLSAFYYDVLNREFK